MRHLLPARNESEGPSDGGGPRASELALAPRPLLVLAAHQECWPRPERLTDLRLQRGRHTCAQLPGAAPHSRRGVGRARPPRAELSRRGNCQQPGRPHGLRHWPRPTSVSPRETHPPRRDRDGCERILPPPPQDRDVGNLPARCRRPAPSSPVCVCVCVCVLSSPLV